MGVKMNILSWLFPSKKIKPDVKIINYRKWDTSTKEYEVLSIRYRWQMCDKKLIGTPKWEHHRYYLTMEKGLQALKDFRTSYSNRWEYKSPVYAYVVELRRFKLIKRNKI
jgi:hypothetical protein